MNAAARLFNQGELSRSWVVSLFFTQFQFKLFACVFILLLTALSLVYVTNTTRSLNASYQQLHIENEHLHKEWGQLLLEKSSLTMQARVQKSAESKLNMVVPDGKSLIVVNLD